MTIKEYMGLSLAGERCVRFAGHLWLPEWSVSMLTVQLNRWVDVAGNVHTVGHTRRIRRTVTFDTEVIPATERRREMIY